MYGFTSALIEGRLIKRYKRFLADIVLSNGDIITAHCPNTGAMTGCDHPDVKVYLSRSDNPKRKYPHTWEYSSALDGSIIGINTANANRVVKSALLGQQVPEFTHYSQCFPETPFGNSRIDFMLKEEGLPNAYIEVKSVTLADGKTASFPDTVTKRGLKHCLELAEIVKQGHKACLFFCIQRENINQFRVAEEIDPNYAQALEYAIKSGVSVLAYQCIMHKTGIELGDRIVIT
jgi:sugar fermentation stimulation protein A